MVESYRQKHHKKQPSATQRLGILLGAALVGFLVLGLVLRALGAGAILFGAALFALGLGLGWLARGRQKQSKVAVLPTRPRVEKTESPESANLARAYANGVLERDKTSSAGVESVAVPASDPPQILWVASSELEINTVNELEPAFSQPILTLQNATETPAPELIPASSERKKWSPKNKVEAPSSAPALLTPTTLEPVKLETASSPTQSTEPLDLETIPLEPIPSEPGWSERKKWTPKSKAHDTLSEAELSALEPVPVFETAAALLEVPILETPILEIQGEPKRDSSLPERKKWVPKAKRETAELEPDAPIKTVLEPPSTQGVSVSGPPVKLDSREILEAMGIRLPSQNTSTVLPEVKKLDSSAPEESEVSSSSGRKKWVPKRKT